MGGWLGGAAREMKNKAKLSLNKKDNMEDKTTKKLQPIKTILPTPSKNIFQGLFSLLVGWINSQ